MFLNKSSNKLLVINNWNKIITSYLDVCWIPHFILLRAHITIEHTIWPPVKCDRYKIWQLSDKLGTHNYKSKAWQLFEIKTTKIAWNKINWTKITLFDKQMRTKQFYKKNYLPETPSRHTWIILYPVYLKIFLKCYLRFVTKVME